MGRNKKPSGPTTIDDSHRQSPVREKMKRRSESPGLMDSKFKMFMAFNITLLGAVIAYVYYLHYLETEVITPLNAPKVIQKQGLDIPERYWGSYRSSLYFGMKNRHPDPVNFGLMWFNHKPTGNDLRIRHWCSTRDGLKQYSWMRHDGINFGEQTIVDGENTIKTSFVKVPGKVGGEWTASFTVEPTNPSPDKEPGPFSFMVYSTADIHTHNLSVNMVDKTHVESIAGSSPDLGNWRVMFHEDGNKPLRYHYLSTVLPAPDEVIDTVQKNIKAVKIDEHPIKLFFVKGKSFASTDGAKKPNFIMTQITVRPPFKLQMVYQNAANDFDRSSELIDTAYETEIAKHRTAFDAKFEKIFGLKQKGFQEVEIEVAKAALSNMIGSIGYFYGASLVKGPHNKDVAEYWKAPLYTAVPSRSFFPRGFLWDEGFHQLLVARWDADISKDIIGHWLDLMNKDGWIPREQILGDEARAQVPPEFIVQRSNNANPPTMFLSIQTLLDMMRKGEIKDDIDFIRRVYPRLERIFWYFENSQKGPVENSYRWRGRDPEARTELNPKTLSSGLDDYPRASHPTEDERHIDLRCWVALMARILSEIGAKIGLPESQYKVYADKYKVLSDNKILNDLHWSSENQYSDFGLHSNNVQLVRQRQKPGDAPPPMIRLTTKAPELQFANFFGYVSLFPLLIKILDPHSPQLGQVLTSLEDRNLLWTDFGLRSLAMTSKLYETRNTEHDPPYWRGNIWININFMAVRALKYYSDVEGPYQAEAARLYTSLRKNVMTNIIQNYQKTGYIWENYRPGNGKGHGSHPFTGWSALVVLLMGEQY